MFQCSGFPGPRYGPSFEINTQLRLLKLINIFQNDLFIFKKRINPELLPCILHVIGHNLVIC